MIPKLRFPEFKSDWKIKRLDSISKISAGGTPSTRILDYWGGHIKWMSSGDLNQRLIYDVDGRITELGLKNSSAKIIPENSVLIGLAGQGKTRGTVAINKVELTSNQSVAYFKNIAEDYQFVYFSLFKDYERLRRLSTGDGGRGGLNLSILGAYKISFPEITEQLKISKLLVILDQKINLLTKKKEALETYKKGLMHKIFSQELRFKREDGTDYPEWETKKLSDVAQKSNIKNKNFTSSRVLTNSAVRGVVAQEDFFDREIVTEKNLESYYISRTGDFIYNPRISSNAPCGPVNRNEIGEGLFSPLYTVFKVKLFYNDYLSFFFQTNLWHKYALAVSNFGARHDRMNISTSDFFSLPFDAPTDKSEMEQIVSVAVCLNQKIELLNNSINSALEFKKGLLQQMFV